MDLLGGKYIQPGITSTSVLGRHALANPILRRAWPWNQAIRCGMAASSTARRSWVEAILDKGNAGNYMIGHVPYTDSFYNILGSKDYKILLSIRDPIDVLLSWVHYSGSERLHYAYCKYKEMSFDERLNIIISGQHLNGMYVEDVKSVLLQTVGWSLNNNVMPVKFESLLGSKGESNDQKQEETVSAIAQFIGVDVFNMRKTCYGLFGKSHTFRKGKIGSLKNELSKDQMEVIYTEIGGLRKLLGYHDELDD